METTRERRREALIERTDGLIVEELCHAAAPECVHAEWEECERCSGSGIDAEHGTDCWRCGGAGSNFTGCARGLVDERGRARALPAHRFHAECPAVYKHVAEIEVSEAWYGIEEED